MYILQVVKKKIKKRKDFHTIGMFSNQTALSKLMWSIYQHFIDT